MTTECGGTEVGGEHHAPSAFLVRRGVPPDSASIAAIVASAFESHRRRIPTLLFDAYLSMASRTLLRKDVVVLVAQAAGRLMGTAIVGIGADQRRLNMPDDYAIIYALAAAPGLLAEGVAGAMLDRSIRISRIAGCSSIVLLTSSFTADACTLYERIGFSRCPEHDIRASTVLGIDVSTGDLTLIAYRLPLTS